MNISKFPYFDNNATTPIHPEVIKVLSNYHQDYYGNPSSKAHPIGIICNALLEKHKKEISELLNVSENDIIFTSGSTESINLAIKGIYFQYSSQKRHIISCKTEHSAVLETLLYLKEHFNCDLTLLEVDANGNIKLDELEKNIREDTLMVCIMTANNETGVIHPIHDIHTITQKKKVLFFSDTTQAFGKMKLDKIPADIFCASSHKFHGCKGIGLLVIRNFNRKIFLHPILHGGQQQVIRSGTIPLPLVASLAKALSIIIENSDKYITHTHKIRNYFEKQLSLKHNIHVHGKSASRISNTSNIMCEPQHYETFIKLMKTFCYSHGSACSDGAGKPSHVLKSMELSDAQIKRSFRFSFSHFNSIHEIDMFLNELDKTINGMQF